VITEPILSRMGKTPLFWPPKAYSPQGAPEMRAIWKQVTKARTRMFSQAENSKIVMEIVCLVLARSLGHKSSNIRVFLVSDLH